MTLLIQYLLIGVALLSSWVYASSNNTYCKPIPGSADWPDRAEWQALNTSLSGRLIAAVPPGLVCQQNSSVYNVDACATVYQEWGNSSWHASEPFTSDYNDEGCLPSKLAPCSAAAYPAFVVNASNAGHVQAAVKFAKRTGVRLIVKGTGHDIPGRSSGPEALSVWTHNIRGVNVTMGDVRAKKYGAVAAVKIAAGMQMREIYAEAVRHNITVVGGGDVDVGIGGWITGAGHSPISSKYGLGADQVLEMEVVTANGTLLTINENSYPGLFWSMRGVSVFILPTSSSTWSCSQEDQGGGSTFAVIISVTVRAYPRLAATLYIYSYNTTVDSDTFWSLTTYFHGQLPTLSDEGVMGYYYGMPSIGDTDSSRSSLFGVWIVPEKTEAQTKAIIRPMEEAISNNTFGWKDAVIVSNTSIYVDDFMSAWEQNTPEGVGVNVRVGSWLLGRKALETNPRALNKILRQTVTTQQTAILGNLVAGQGVKNVKIPGGGNAVLPAWRNAYVHYILPVSWPYLNETAKIAATTELRNVQVEALRQLAPNSGAYVNEADPTEPDWQRAFWGANYPRLLELKNYWDPTGVFWCKPCVGHELWTVESQYGIEGGIGQTPGRICKG
ncbi:hypothetical protein H2204_001404 [Knufia peltigerae]|uniref:FAD-binding PCMH-type domain-containing protein n=1 Tax=Knufia peltigerae TaxID=1002370 RepID=A0AA39D2A6_9EURO|nr:hypothetical protein H2204_001404 [Knufia peltigerae]